MTEVSWSGMCGGQFTTGDVHAQLKLVRSMAGNTSLLAKFRTKKQYSGFVLKDRDYLTLLEDFSGVDMLMRNHLPVCDLKVELEIKLSEFNLNIEGILVVAQNQTLNNLFFFNTSVRMRTPSSQHTPLSQRTPSAQVRPNLYSSKSPGISSVPVKTNQKSSRLPK
jgi:hypothetical protein